MIQMLQVGEQKIFLLLFQNPHKIFPKFLRYVIGEYCNTVVFFQYFKTYVWVNMAGTILSERKIYLKFTVNFRKDCCRVSVIKGLRRRKTLPVLMECFLTIIWQNKHFFYPYLMKYVVVFWLFAKICGSFCCLLTNLQIILRILPKFAFVSRCF